MFNRRTGRIVVLKKYSLQVNSRIPCGNVSLAEGLQLINLEVNVSLLEETPRVTREELTLILSINSNRSWITKKCLSPEQLSVLLSLMRKGLLEKKATDKVRTIQLDITQRCRDVIYLHEFRQSTYVYQESVN